MMKHNQRADLIYRNMLPKESAAAPVDAALEAIRSKVVAHLSKTNPEDWGSGEWSAFLKLYTAKATTANSNPSISASMATMTAEQLKEKLTNSAGA